MHPLVAARSNHISSPDDGQCSSVFVNAWKLAGRTAASSSAIARPGGMQHFKKCICTRFLAV